MHQLSSKPICATVQRQRGTAVFNFSQHCHRLLYLTFGFPSTEISQYLWLITEVHQVATMSAFATEPYKAPPNEVVDEAHRKRSSAMQATHLYEGANDGKPSNKQCNSAKMSRGARRTPQRQYFDGMSTSLFGFRESFWTNKCKVCANI